MSGVLKNPAIAFGLTFPLLRSANSQRQEEWKGSGSADLAFRALEVAGEVGEVAEKAKKLIRAQRGIGGSTATPEEVGEEIGDAIISLDLLAREIGLDTGAIVARKFNATSDKYELKTRLPTPEDREELLFPVATAHENGPEADLVGEDAREEPISVPDRLRALADLYEERNKQYGDNYRHFGHVMNVMMPGPVTIESPEDWNRVGVWIQVVAKMSRFAQAFLKRKQPDSLDDLSVYSQMLSELEDM